MLSTKSTRKKLNLLYSYLIYSAVDYVPSLRNLSITVVEIYA
jgi:hypothetical protein